MTREFCPFSKSGGDETCPRLKVYKGCLRPKPYAYLGLTPDQKLHGDYRDNGCDKFRFLAAKKMEEEGCGVEELF